MDKWWNGCLQICSLAFIVALVTGNFAYTENFNVTTFRNTYDATSLYKACDIKIWNIDLFMNFTTNWWNCASGAAMLGLVKSCIGTKFTSQFGDLIAVSIFLLSSLSTWVYKWYSVSLIYNLMITQLYWWT